MLNYKSLLEIITNLYIYWSLRNSNTWSFSVCSVAGPSLWDSDLARQIIQVVNQRPRNGFEEMIQWTREGKLWQYPIHNEAGEWV